MVERTWRNPMARRPEQRPTVNVAVTGIEHVVPRAQRTDNGIVSLEIVPGISLYGEIHTLERLTAEARACVRSVQ